MMNRPSVSSVLIVGKNQHLVARYEELRRQALGGGGGLGLALFLRQGMKVWIETWSECAVHIPKAVSDDAGRDLVVPPPLHNEIVILLAGMTLNSHREVAK